MDLMINLLEGDTYASPGTYMRPPKKTQFYNLNYAANVGKVAGTNNTPSYSRIDDQESLVL